MNFNRSRNLAEQLDTALDGRREELPDELAPLLAAADELRAELDAFTLDPVVTQKHLNHVYRRSRVHPASRRRQVALGWRRRVVSIGFAAVLLAVPASIASANSKPGDALYPIKLGIERVRLLAATSPSAEAEERTRIANVRLEELQGLLQAAEFGRIPAALEALQAAVLDAEQAVASARSHGADSTVIAALESQLNGLSQAQAAALNQTLASLPEAKRKELLAAISKTSTSLSSDPGDSRGPGTGGPGTTSPPTTAGPGPGTTTATTQCVATRGGTDDRCGAEAPPPTTTTAPPQSTTTTSTTVAPTSSTAGGTSTSGVVEELLQPILGS
ncbi:MAG TPA: DUF5667 domain-containing protein [Actinomycetes bacterium]|nr:DUF5667 domain-containing protein [Actinomycetes bacterium]